ncbi:hypothetical protein SELMODRAFT_157053 [Selaginella moellendorffii]|uniref:UDP-glycosyltransferases domain-containing protein n=1 Tax=Selaginella moellendorffii TaxID=88036 RepID=D8SP13_SELML|nr:hypothetical protein SELMODRAFT_157053 [Selaginella moellendorffii]
MLWLSKQPRRSVVYISLGSIVLLRLDQIEELAFALEASQQRFLWVLRSPDSSSADREVLPEGFRGERGLVVRDSWVPQLAILGHESTGVFLTHCGWNSVLEGLCMGVLMLTLPSFSDQALNSRMVEELQVAWRVSKTSTDRLSRHSIEGLIRRAMEEPRQKIESLMATARNIKIL